MKWQNLCTVEGIKTCDRSVFAAVSSIDYSSSHFENETHIATSRPHFELLLSLFLGC